MTLGHGSLGGSVGRQQPQGRGKGGRSGAHGEGRQPISAAPKLPTCMRADQCVAIAPPPPPSAGICVRCSAAQHAGSAPNDDAPGGPPGAGRPATTYPHDHNVHAGGADGLGTGALVVRQHFALHVSVGMCAGVRAAAQGGGAALGHWVAGVPGWGWHAACRCGHGGGGGREHASLVARTSRQPPTAAAPWGGRGTRSGAERRSTAWCATQPVRQQIRSAPRGPWDGSRWDGSDGPWGGRRAQCRGCRAWPPS